MNMISDAVKMLFSFSFGCFMVQAGIPVASISFWAIAGSALVFYFMGAGFAQKATA